MKTMLSVDWLSLYVEDLPNHNLEDYNYLTDGRFKFEKQVHGTQSYSELYMVFDVHENRTLFAEIAKNPYSKILCESGGIIKMSNSVLYAPHCWDIYIDLLEFLHATTKSVNRIDLACDFVPVNGSEQLFIRKVANAELYRRGRLGKFSFYGSYVNHQLVYTGATWGSRQSNVFTRLYNKTQEMLDEKDKPYIRSLWYQYGLVSSMDDTDTKVWRVEFEVKNGTFTQEMVIDTFQRDGLKGYMYSLICNHFMFAKTFKTNSSRMDYDAPMNLLDGWGAFDNTRVVKPKDKCKIPNADYSVKVVIKRLYIELLSRGEQSLDTSAIYATLAYLLETYDLMNWYDRHRGYWIAENLKSPVE